jgi:type IV pilus assembly protein PilQ
MMSAHNVIRRISRSRVTALGLGAWLLCSALPAFATNVLQNISHAPGPNGRVDIVLQFADPIADAQVFTTDNPPRIAIDLPDTHNGLAERRVMVGNGSANAVSAAEANGRTRVVVDLFRPAAYESRIEGNRLVLSVANSGATQPAAAAVAATRGPILASSMDPSRRVAGALSVSNVDFRRGANGAGRVVLRFTGPGAAADMHNEGSHVLIDVGNAMLPSNLAKRIDVADFATPVQAIETRGQSGGTRLTISTSGAFDSMAYQSGNEYVVEITPKNGSGKSASSAGTIGGSNAMPVYHGKPATFNFQDVPVRTVLQLIAEESGLNVVASDTVSGNLTLRLINVPWDQALDIVLRAKGLDKRKDGDVIWIAPQKEISDYEQAREDARIAIDLRQETVTEYIPINYGNAEDIAKLLTEESKSGTGGGAAGAGGAAMQRGFLSPRGSVSFDRRTNTLLLSDIPKKVKEVKELVKLLDRPVDQVLIEARIVIADESFARDLGARFGVHGQRGNVVTSGSLESNVNYTNGLVAAQQAVANGSTPTPPAFLFPGGLNVNLPVTPNAGSMALSILNHGLSLDMELSALQSEGRGEVISNPRVITSNQKEALITQGDEIGYFTVGASTGTTVPTPIVAFKDVLLSLKVTPTITNDGRVYMALDVKKDELARFLTSAAGSVPQITKREVTTAVLVESGQTVVIGGVYEFKSREDLSKVPFLADLPLLGNLFKQTNKSHSKAELLVFITPKILQLSHHD